MGSRIAAAITTNKITLSKFLFENGGASLDNDSFMRLASSNHHTTGGSNKIFVVV